jgi:hypothetical protein
VASGSGSSRRRLAGRLQRGAYPLSAATRIRAAVFAATLLASAAAVAAPPPGAVEDLADSVQALVDAADRITAEDGEAEADQMILGRKAAELLARGRRQLAEGDRAGAQATLKTAYDAATQVIVGLRSGKTQVNRRKDQYTVGANAKTDQQVALLDARIQTVKALAEAYRRVIEEKGGGDRARLADALRRVEAAQGMVLLGRLPEAQREVAGAYEQVSDLVVGVRQGDKLVKTLVFDSPADEYRYELDRLTSYRMLVRLTAAEDGNAATMAATIERAEAQAVLLGERAADEAKENRWPEAVRTLESATTLLADVLRLSGKWIPR